MFDFDLQLFAEETETENVTNVTEAVAEEPAAEPIPPELAGLSEETARALMDEAKANEPKEEPTKEEEPKEGEQAAPAEPASDTQQEPPQRSPIPYERFKQEVDKKNDLKRQLEELQAQVARLQQPVQQPVQQPQQPPARPQPTVNPAVFQQINQLAMQGAMQMTGMSAEDVASLEYAEDNDPQKIAWQSAMELARSNIFANMRQRQAQQQAEAYRIFQENQANVNAYNEFANREMTAPDYEDIKNYAINDFYFKQSPLDQKILAEAYSRIERQMASGQDVKIIKDYYAAAAANYRGEHAPAPQPQNVKSKVKQANAMPRASQVTGTSGGSGGVNSAVLERIMQDVHDGKMAWGAVDPEYKQMILNAAVPISSQG